jgi:hypothetical protein
VRTTSADFKEEEKKTETIEVKSSEDLMGNEGDQKDDVLD